MRDRRARVSSNIASPRTGSTLPNGRPARSPPGSPSAMLPGVPQDEIVVTHVSGKAATRGPQRFAKDCVQLGRLSDNDVVFEEYGKKLSRYHAAVFAVDGVLYIKDMESKNGTWVNEAR